MKRFRKCGSCFRFQENWRDVKARGLKSQEDLSGITNYGRKPRKGVACICTNVSKQDEPHANDKGCKYHQYRWSWNLQQWWSWDFKYRLKRWFDEHIRCHIGSLRKPVPLEWKDSYDSIRDIIIKNGEPVCPHCGEMPYSYKQCVFCGQRFVQDEKAIEMSKPPEEEAMDCFVCGGKGTMKGHRAKINGHFHGMCEKCGAVCME